MFEIISHEDLRKKVDTFDAIAYCRTRNYLDGNVSYLSPYITHWIISIRDICTIALERFSVAEAEQRYKELLWKEYFLQVYWWLWDAIFSDIEESKTGIPTYECLPDAIFQHTFASEWVNQAIKQLEETWYLHNHVRMWIASYLTHWHRLDRKKYADRSYFHFLDGELASNHLSWQRVQSTFSHKPYIMNEENLQKYWGISDALYRGSYEDIAEKLFDSSRVPLFAHAKDYSSQLQGDYSMIPSMNPSKYSWYTVLTPWDLHPSKINDPTKTVCVLDSNFLDTHPWSKNRVAFVQAYTDLYGIECVYGSVQKIVEQSTNLTVYETPNPSYKEAYKYIKKHNNGRVHPYDWINPHATKRFTKKFFPYRKESKPFLQTM